MSTRQEWITGYELDLTGLVTTSKFADGAITLGGKPWYAENAANASTFQITNGSGLIIALNSNGSDFPSRTSPLVTGKVSDLLGQTMEMFSRIRLWMNMTFTNVNEAWEVGGVGFENYRALTVGTFNSSINRVSDDTWTSASVINGSEILSTQGTNLTHDCVMVELAPLTWQSLFYTGNMVSASVFPSKINLQRRANCSFLPAQTMGTGYYGFADVNALAAVLFAYNTPGLGNSTFTFKRLRLDYLVGES